MKKRNYNIIRKDDKLENTINKISKIAKQNRIKIRKCKTKSINHIFYSSRLELNKFYNLGVNGKGLSKKAALASAYGELMERIQTGFLINNSYLSKEKNTTNFKDESAKDLNTVKFDYNTFFESNNYKEFIKRAKNFNVVSNFTNFFNNENKLLPIKLINAVTHTNGLCAGNSREEALCQGICEILERYCYHEIIFRKIKLKNVSINQNEYIYSKIKEIEHLGYEIEIKDCTLEIFPVIGVLIKNNIKNSYLFTMAADTNINIAIQRCLTELFQGLSSKKYINKKMKLINNNYNMLSKEELEINWFKCYNSNNGIHPMEIFNSNEIIDYLKLPFDNNDHDNKDSLAFLTNLLLNNNYNIYYKEYSQLNFNSYRIYIPGLSEIDKIKEYEYNFLINKDSIEKIIFNLKNASEKDIKFILNNIKNVYNKSKYKMMDCGTIFHSKHYINTNLNNISLETLYILLSLKINKNVKHNNHAIKNYINNISNKDKFNYITKKCNIIFPTCPQCSECPLKKQCKFKEWKNLNNKIQKK